VSGEVLEKRHRVAFSSFRGSCNALAEADMEHFPGVLVVVHRAEAGAMSPVERIFWIIGRLPR